MQRPALPAPTTTTLCWRLPELEVTAVEDTDANPRLVLCEVGLMVWVVVMSERAFRQALDVKLMRTILVVVPIQVRASIFNDGTGSKCHKDKITATACCETDQKSLSNRRRREVCLLLETSWILS